VIPLIHRRDIQAFSLIEVVVALAVFVFAGVALVGVLAVGIQSNRDSKEQLQAANIAECICATRRATPMTDFTVSTSQPGFPLPVLYSSTWSPSYTTNNFTTPTYLTWDGTTTTLASGNARFGFLFNITAPTNYVSGITPGRSTVYMSLYWPAQASAAAAPGHFELNTTFALP
jgi:type II secretory pathway pseudopilin PulG